MVSHFSHSSANPERDIDRILADLKEQKFLIVSSRHKNGLILYKRHHAEFAGPGALVGGIIDPDVTHLIPVGKWSISPPEDDRDRQRAILMRRQWLVLFKKTTAHNRPHNRIQQILTQFENWFDPETVAQIPDEAIARLVGVLPPTVTEVRHATDW